MIWQNTYQNSRRIKIYKLSLAKFCHIAACIIVSAVTLIMLCCTIAQAKLGSSIDTFKQKLGANFKLINEEKKVDKVYYHFSVITDDKIQKSAPGFGGGLTITAEAGKISGESLLVRIGNNRRIGKKLAGVLCLNLAYEAIAKPIPAKIQDQNAELNSYVEALSDAMGGRPGRISYPGYPTQLIFSNTPDHNLLFVISNKPTDKH